MGKAAARVVAAMGKAAARVVAYMDTPWRSPPGRAGQPEVANSLVRQSRVS